MNLLVAARARGLEPDVAILPDPDDADLLACVVLRPGPETAEQDLAAAIRTATPTVAASPRGRRRRP